MKMKLAALKAFEVTGWVQYKTDMASPVKRIQLALSPKGAIEQVKSHYNNVQCEYSFILTAEEVA